MKIIRWLLSHLFLILLIVAVIYGYMFWGNLAGENTPAGKAIAYLSTEFVEVEEFISAVKAKQSQLSADHEQVADNEQNAASQDSETVDPSDSIAQQRGSAAFSQKQDDQVADIESQAEVATAGAQPVNQHNQIAEPALTIGQGEVAANNVASLPAAGAANAQDKFVSTKVEQQLNNVDKSGNVINKSLNSKDIRESWVTARKSFYQRKYELSEQSYQDVINNTTDNFDAYGELGNVYFNQGKKEKAAEAYFEAASILVRKGQVRRARSLMGLLRHLDENKANDLQKLIVSTVS